MKIFKPDRYTPQRYTPDFLKPKNPHIIPTPYIEDLLLKLRVPFPEYDPYDPYLKDDIEKIYFTDERKNLIEKIANLIDGRGKNIIVLSESNFELCIIEVKNKNTVYIYKLDYDIINIYVKEPNQVIEFIKPFIPNYGNIVMNDLFMENLKEYLI